MAYEPTLEHLTSMDFKIETGGTTILFRDYTSQAIMETYPANSITAVANGVGIKVAFTGGEKTLVDALDLSTIKIDGSLVTQVQATAINELNALFANAGGGNAPTITSSATINLPVGNSINFTPTGTNVVTWSYDTLPTGIVSVEGQHKTIIGGSGLSAGTYNIVVRATNYHGSVTQAITLTVSATFTNTLSFSGTGNAWMRNVASATYNTTAFYRPGGGSGITDAWSCSFWLKTNFTGTASQSYGLILYGYSGNATKPIFTLLHDTSNAGTDSNLYFKFGVGDCYTVGLTDITDVSDASIPSNTWFHVMWTYSGGATVNTGAGFFNFYINGVLKTTTWSFVGPGTYHATLNQSINRSTGYDLVLLRGTKTYNYLAEYAPNSFLEEFATWKGVELGLSDSVNLYNSGTPFDINASFTPLPYTYFRCGDDGDVAADPIMADKSIGGSNIDLTMQGGTVANYVSDVPT